MHEIDEYLTLRVDDQIRWYDEKSKQAQKKYKQLQTMEIIIAALIPILSGMSTKHFVIPIIIGILGAAIIVIEALSSLNNYHENWIEYRSTCELLKHEKWLYEMRAYPYGDNSTPENLFVSKIENLISSESNKWKTNNADKLNLSKKNQSASKGS